MAIYQDGVKVKGVYSDGVEVKRVFHDGELVFSSEPQYVTDGLIMHLDGHTTPSGNVWIDLSAEENHVTLNPAVTYDSTLKGYVFNGGQTGVSLKNLALPSGNFPFTMEMVFNIAFGPATSSYGMCWFGNATSASNGRITAMHYYGDRRIVVNFTNTTIVNDARITFGKIGASSFAKSSGDIGTFDYSFLVDGVKYPYTWLDSSGNMAIPNSPLTIGQGFPYNPPFRHMTGTIHSVRIYNRQLTLDEQKHNYSIDEKRFNII